MKQLREKFVARGHNVGGVDGVLRNNTREAVWQEQQRLGMQVDGWPKPELLKAM